MKHLENNNVSYTYHWKRAMKMSIALFIHAWIPNCLEYYASEQLKKIQLASEYIKNEEITNKDETNYNFKEILNDTDLD